MQNRTHTKIRRMRSHYLELFTGLPLTKHTHHFIYCYTKTANKIDFIFSLSKIRLKFNMRTSSSSPHLHHFNIVLSLIRLQLLLFISLYSILLHLWVWQYVIRIFHNTLNIWKEKKLVFFFLAGQNHKNFIVESQKAILLGILRLLQICTLYLKQSDLVFKEINFNQSRN